MPPVTREDRAKADKYAQAVAQINSKAKELRDLQNSLPNLLDSMSQTAQERLVHTAPKHWHAEAALKWISGAIGKEIRTQSRAAQLLNDGELPGDFYGIPVKISVRYISNIKVKLESGMVVQDEKGKPSHLSSFEIEFIRSVLEHQQLRAKSLLISTVQMLARVIVLIKRGAVAVADLDARVEMKQKHKGPIRRANNRRARISNDADSDEDTDDEDNSAPSEAFADLKRVLGDALSLQLQLPEMSRYPTRRQVRKLCKKHGWSVRKGQQTTCWRYEGVNPPIIKSYFSNVLRIFVDFNIVLPGQKSNCDEKRLNAEFEKSGRCLSVVCVRPSEKMSGHRRITMTNSASSRSIAGLTFLPFINADDTTLLMVFIRKGDVTSSESKRKEAEIWNACYRQFEEVGIELVVMTSSTGYMNADTFVHCICHFLRVLHRREGLIFQFQNSREPRIEECPPLRNNQVLFADNASHHKLGNLLFQMECRVRKLQISPLPPNSTEVTQALDQEVLKMFTLWVMNFFLIEMEIEMSGGIRNPLHLVLWSQQLRMSNAHREASNELILDLEADFTGNPQMIEQIRRLNATLLRANTEQRKFDEIRVATICVAPWLAALKYARRSFQSVGLAAPDVNLGPELRGRQSFVQIEHEQEKMARYEIYPERITTTSMYLNAADKFEKLELAANESKIDMYNKGAQLVGALPDLQRSRVCSGSATGAAHAGDVASVVFGPNPSAEAVNLSKVIIQASEFVNDRNAKRQRIQDYEELMPRAVADVEQRLQDLTEAGIANLREKVKHVQRSFEIVSEKATSLSKACSKLESHQAFSGPFVQKQFEHLLLAINDSRSKLLDRKVAVETELAKKKESRQKFIESCRSDFVPELQLKEVLGDELTMDWGAEQLVREAGLAVLRVVDYVFEEVATKLAGAFEVDDDVRRVMAEFFGEVEVEVVREIEQ